MPWRSSVVTPPWVAYRIRLDGGHQRTYVSRRPAAPWTRRGRAGTVTSRMTKATAEARGDREPAEALGEPLVAFRRRLHGTVTPTAMGTSTAPASQIVRTRAAGHCSTAGRGEEEEGGLSRDDPEEQEGPTPPRPPSCPAGRAFGCRSRPKMLTRPVKQSREDPPTVVRYEAERSPDQRIDRAQRALRRRRAVGPTPPAVDGFSSGRISARRTRRTLLVLADLVHADVVVAGLRRTCDRGKGASGIGPHVIDSAISVLRDTSPGLEVRRAAALPGEAYSPIPEVRPVLVGVGARSNSSFGPADG